MKKTNKFLAFGIILCMLFSLAVVPVGAEEGLPAGDYPIHAGYYDENGEFKIATGILIIEPAIINSGTCGDNLTWTLYDGGHLTISGTGDMKNYTGDSAPPWGYLDVSTVIIENGVTSIGDLAFYYCTSLTSITISDSVTSIGICAFYECSSLTSITIPDSVTSIGDHTFRDCSSLTSITIPDSVTSIGESAFSGCSSLTSITIPDSVTNIGDYAFCGCSRLTSITIPDSVTSIGGFAFGDCINLTSITIPDSVTSIGDGAFGECSSLTSITIPDSVTSIASMAFEGCSSLTSITIPDSVTSIGDFAFYYCTSLTSITIPDSVTRIGVFAFIGCSNLKDVYYSGSEEDWNDISIGSSNTSLTNATIHYNHIQSKSLEEPLDCNGDTLTLIENGVLDIGENLYLRNAYVYATNGYIKSGDKKITGENIYFTNSGKIRLQDGYTAKVEKDNGNGTTDQGFMVGMENPRSLITMTLEITGTANDVYYTGRTISKDFDFTNYEVTGLVNFGFTVTNIPKPLSLSIQSIE